MTLSARLPGPSFLRFYSRWLTPSRMPTGNLTGRSINYDARCVLFIAVSMAGWITSGAIGVEVCRSGPAFLQLACTYWGNCPPLCFKLGACPLGFFTPHNASIGLGCVGSRLHTRRLAKSHWLFLRFDKRMASPHGAVACMDQESN